MFSTCTSCRPGTTAPPHNIKFVVLLIITDFKVYVRMKFEELAKNQQELISQLKRVASATRGATAEEIDDVHSQPMTTFKEMEEMCEKLRDKDSNFRKMMVRLCFTALIEILPI